MTLKETLAALEAAGTEKNRKVYPRHGIRPPMYGVGYGDLEKLRARIRLDHPLARGLWASGNHDARILATMVADPKQTASADLEAWIGDCDNYVLMEALAKLAAQTPDAPGLLERWIEAKDEWRSAAGWTVLGGLLLSRPASFSSRELEGYIARIERNLAKAPNRTRHAMNGALIGIGCVSDELSGKAIAAAKRIGPVEVDHGQTGCKTPDAAAYIPKARAHFAAKPSKASPP